MMLLWALISIVVVAKSAPIEESETDPCYLKNAHHLTIGSFGYTLTTCFDEYEESLCLTNIPIEMEECPVLWGQCYTHYWRSNSIVWRTIICKNPFTPGNCFWDSSINICSEDQLDACTCEPTPPPPTTEETSPTTEAPPPTTQEPSPTTEEPTTTEPVPTTPPVGERCIYTDAHLHIDEENRYTITTCFDESEGTLCLVEAPLPQCSSSDFCRSYWWETFFIDWNIVVCCRPSGYCFLRSIIPNCLEAQETECVCNGDTSGERVCIPENCDA